MRVWPSGICAGWDGVLAGVGRSNASAGLQGFQELEDIQGWSTTLGSSRLRARIAWTAATREAGYSRCSSQMAPF